MGKELRKLKQRKEVKSKLELIDDKQDTQLVIHYSCESFYDIKDGRTPRITSIAIRNLSTGQTSSFSIHKCAEQRQIPWLSITEKFDELEKTMLDEYFDFIKTRHGYSFIHWNMRDINYGFQAIEHRYKVLGGEPIIIEDSKKFDLPKALISLYGETYIPHGEQGRLFSLIELNKISGKDILDGKQEAAAFTDREFVKLHQSTLRKVDIMANILNRVLNGTIKTMATWREIYGIYPAVLIELITKHWAWSCTVFVAALIGLAASLKSLF